MKQEMFTIVAIKSGGDRRPGVFDYQTLFTTKNEAEFNEFQQMMLERHAGFRRDSYTRNRREIKVLHVDTQKHEPYLHGTKGRNGLKSKPVHRGQLFGSAEASGHLGLRNNEVSMALSRAEFTGTKEATLRGVTLAYAD